MSTFTPEMLKQFPIFQHMATFAATLEVAHVRVQAVGEPIIVIEFANLSEREAFLEAIRFVQSAHKGRG